MRESFIFIQIINSNGWFIQKQGNWLSAFIYEWMNDQQHRLKSNAPILTWNDVFTCDCECARGCDVSACVAGDKRIGTESASNETDRPVTDPGRSCEKTSDSIHWLVNWCNSSKVHMWPWTTKIVISSTGIFIAVANNTLYGSKLPIFLVWQKS